MEKLPKRALATTLGIDRAQVLAYPQAGLSSKSCSLSGYRPEACIPTPFNLAQVLDKKGENDAIPRRRLPLSTTTSLI